MPPRATPPPAGKPRRRTGPPVSGAWLWLVVGLALVAMLLFNTFNNAVEIQYSTFLRLLKNSPKNFDNLSISAEKIAGEFKDIDDLPETTKEEEKLKEKFQKKRTKKFVVRRWPA